MVTGYLSVFMLINGKYQDISLAERLIFSSGMMETCYIVFNGEAVVVNAIEHSRREIESIINKLMP